MSQPQKPRLKNVKKVIAVGSGKGGVGKSTTAVNLALAWHQQGLKVGLLDADIYGPNQPKMLGVQDQPAMEGIGGHLHPVEVQGLYTMSIGYLVEANTPMVLRGPMISKLMEQMLFQTDWPELDVLVVDLPPGTGDIQLSLSKKIAVDGAVIVTTPQDVALLDARKAIEMFKKVDVPVLGVIENMSTHTCSSCGYVESIFGEAGGAALASLCDLPLLGQLPLALAIREACDRGSPIVLSSSAESDAYLAIAEKISGLLKKDTVKFPDIVVEG
ncbi:MAG: Mrp/NBP35 family ATP-binding protein [Coxiellaceae bacterium]|nr:Mrp/NBP35 family ATP-binding protein [Coxiellaceae bacterium]